MKLKLGPVSVPLHINKPSDPRRIVNQSAPQLTASSGSLARRAYNSPAMRAVRQELPHVGRKLPPLSVAGEPSNQFKAASEQRAQQSVVGSKGGAEAEDANRMRLVPSGYDQELLHPELRVPLGTDRFPGVDTVRIAPYLKLATNDAVRDAVMQLTAVAESSALTKMLDEHISAAFGSGDVSVAKEESPQRRLIVLGERHDSQGALFQTLLGATSSLQKEGAVLLLEQAGQEQADQVYMAGEAYLFERANNEDAPSMLGDLIKANNKDGYLMALGLLAKAANLDVRPFDPFFGSGSDLLTREKGMLEKIQGALSAAQGRTVVVVCGAYHVGPIHEYFTRDEFRSDTSVAAAAQISAAYDEEERNALMHLRERTSYVLAEPNVLAWRATENLETTTLNVENLLADRGLKLPL